MAPPIINLTTNRRQTAPAMATFALGPLSEHQASCAVRAASEAAHRSAEDARRPGSSAMRRRGPTPWTEARSLYGPPFRGLSQQKVVWEVSSLLSGRHRMDPGRAA
jgi:hypothetical protein